VGKGKRESASGVILMPAEEVQWAGGKTTTVLALIVLSLLVLMIIPIIQGSHQEDAEELFGLNLDTLEEELLAMLATVSAPPPSTPANTRKNAKLGSVTGTTNAAASANTESESVVSHEDADGDGWLEVGKRNRTVVTRTVCLVSPFFSFFLVLVLCRVFYCSFPSSFPSLLDYFLASFLHCPFTRLLTRHSPTHR
jgi:hypothetical protein